MNVITLLFEPRLHVHVKHVLAGATSWRSGSIRKVHGKKSKLYAQCYRVLEIENDADQETVRRAFINMCKKYHPDTSGSAADLHKFHEIENAYRILQNKFAEERWNVNEGIGEYGLYYDEKKRKREADEAEDVKIFDIKHNAPQHRQYLSYGGVGSGTPSQREKQYNTYRRLNAITNIYDHRIKKVSNESLEAEQALIIKDKAEARKIKTRYGMDRLVEDLIQESMAKGEFDNLRGAGKPLPESNYNPYVDFVTHKMNQVLIDNGFVPEWITLQKEIQDHKEKIRVDLLKERRSLGPLPLNEIEKENWTVVVEKSEESVKLLNKKIDQFNLVVPILDKQMLHFNLSRECERILETGECAAEHQHVKKTKAEPGQSTAEKNKSKFDFYSVFLS